MNATDAMDATNQVVDDLSTVVELLTEVGVNRNVPTALVARLGFMLQRKTEALKQCIDAERTVFHGDH